MLYGIGSSCPNPIPPRKRKTKGPRNHYDKEMRYSVEIKMGHGNKCVIFRGKEFSVNILAHSDFEKNILLLSGLVPLQEDRKTHF